MDLCVPRQGGINNMQHSITPQRHAHSLHDRGHVDGSAGAHARSVAALQVCVHVQKIQKAGKS
jgi:hypothetical protein